MKTGLVVAIVVLLVLGYIFKLVIGQGHDVRDANRA